MRAGRKRPKWRGLARVVWLMASQSGVAPPCGACNWRAGGTYRSPASAPDWSAGPLERPPAAPGLLVSASRPSWLQRFASCINGCSAWSSAIGRFLLWAGSACNFPVPSSAECRAAGDASRTLLLSTAEVAGCYVPVLVKARKPRDTGVGILPTSTVVSGWWRVSPVSSFPSDWRAAHQPSNQGYIQGLFSAITR